VHPHNFSVREESLDDRTHVIEVRGDLDVTTTDHLTAAFRRAVERGKTHVVIDLAETTFLDSTALAALLKDARQLRGPGSALALVASQHAQPRGRFDMTGSGQVLNLCATRDEAVDLVDHLPAPSPQAPAPSVVRFSLYVDGASPNAAHAIGELEELRRTYLPDAEVEVVDIAERPEVAERERLLAAPTLVRTSPPPVRRIIGDLSDHAQVLRALGLQHAGSG
jgi:circadian clock protein KaiB